jgi:hypothetical protein
MKKLLLCVLVVLSYASGVYSQTEIKEDTIGKSNPELQLLDAPSQPQMPVEYGTTPPINNSVNPSPAFTFKLDPVEQSYYTRPPSVLKNTKFPFANDYNTGGIIPLTNRSWISGGSSRESFLIGTIGQSTAIYNNQLTNDFAFGVGTTIKKYEYVGQQFRDASLRGSLSYRLSDRIHMNLVGEYSVQRSDGGYGSFLDGFYPESPGELSHVFKPISTAQFNINYQITDWLSLSPGAYFSSYAFPNQTHNDYGLSGKLGIQVSERIKFNLMGSKSLQGNYNFAPNGTLYSPATYGGTIEYKFNETFGVEAGVLRELDMFTGKWKTKPILRPTIHLGK